MRQQVTGPDRRTPTPEQGLDFLRGRRYREQGEDPERARAGMRAPREPGTGRRAPGVPGTSWRPLRESGDGWKDPKGSGDELETPKGVGERVGGPPREPGTDGSRGRMGGPPRETGTGVKAPRLPWTDGRTPRESETGGRTPRDRWTQTRPETSFRGSPRKGISRSGVKVRNVCDPFGVYVRTHRIG